MVDIYNSVIIECCQDCAKHEWCTSHDEERYTYFFNAFKKEIETEFSAIKVYANLDLRTGKKQQPVLGAFEILFRGEVLFSKLAARAWPKLGQVLDKIDILLGGNGGYGNRTLPRIPSKYIVASTHASIPPKRATSCFSQPQSPRDFQTASPNESIYARQPSIAAKNDLSFEETNYLPPIKGSSNYVQNNDDDRKWPKTKFYRRYQSPLRLHTLKNNTNSTIQYFRKDEILEYVSFETQIPEGLTRENSAGLNNRHASRKVSLKNTSMQTEDFIGIIVNERSVINQNLVLEGNENIIKQENGNDVRISPKSISVKTETPCNHDSKMVSSKEKFEAINGEEIQHQEPSNQESAIRKSDGTGNTKEDVEKKITMLGPEPGQVTHLENSLNKEDSRKQSIIFPEKKKSIIQIPKVKGMKKKITIQSDQGEESLIKIETQTPQILNMETNEFLIAKDESTKISLKFEPQEEEKTEDYVLFLYKNGNPWLKINIQAKYI